MSIETRNPASPDSVVAVYTETRTTDIDALVIKAQSAQRQWSAIPQPERGRLIDQYLNALEARGEDIARIITLEMGKTLTESRGEVAKSIAEGRMVQQRAAAAIGELLPSQVPGVTAYSMRRPRGVVVGINPWNFPFGTPVRKSIPALVYGNAILLKPASQTPGAVQLMADIAADLLPEGLVQAVIGSGSMGESLCGHPGVHAVTFTGSVAVGKRVAAAAVSHLAEVSLELGGKNPVILNDASRLDVALDQIFTAAFALCGQRCTAISRVIVHRDLLKQTVDGLVSRATDIIPSDGTVEGARMGPLSSRSQLDDVDAFVSRAREAGATVAAGGQRLELVQGGYFYPPTVLSGVTPDMEIAREEVFGPVLSVLSFDTLDQALQIANDVAYGLTSCLYSEQAPVIERFLSESESGMLHVNAGSFPENHVPFVGIKDSALGVGGSNGPSTIQFYTTEHAVYRKGQA
ncbi:aldehyde dehydrogenase family protein [Granulosicoccus sp. 3-233]|uniref:aldehyde dehydrogenase family protein n=1 Tax=Granulosicoccus sp. 3-233 TaxID=3417969 RepID=UPI003D333938